MRVDITAPMDTSLNYSSETMRVAPTRRYQGAFGYIIEK
jgi:hypothetical protein